MLLDWVYSPPRQSDQPVGGGGIKETKENKSMNMFKGVKVKNIQDYWASLPESRREILEKLHQIILETAPSLKPNFLYNMPGYGSFKYKNHKGESLDWPTVAVASQKNYVSIYVCAVDKDGYLAEKYRARLGKVSVGRSCIRFKKMEDLDLDILKELIELAEKSPGLRLSA